MPTTTTALSCELINHFDCVHRDSDHDRPGLLTYLDGWASVAAVIELADAEDDGTILAPTIDHFERYGVRDDYDLGVRDALIAAFGL